MDLNLFPLLPQPDSITSPKQSLVFLSLLFLTILKIFLAQSDKPFCHCRKMELMGDNCVQSPQDQGKRRATPRPRQEESDPKTKARRDLSAELAFASDSNFSPSYTVLSPHNSFSDCNQKRSVDRECQALSNRCKG